MEIPVMSRISGFEAEITRLQNPSLIARVFHLVGFEEISHIQSFWTWGALILAFVATFTGLINKTVLVIFRFRKGKAGIAEPLLRTFSDDDDSETCSSSSLSDDESEPTSPLENQRPLDEETRVAGSGYCDEYEGRNCKLKLWRRRSSEDRFSWSEFANGNSVVKLWDGLGLGFENSTRSLISLWDLNRNEITSSFYGARCQIPAVSMISPSVLVSAGFENSRNVALRVWDTRVGRQTPEIFAEWQPRRRKVVGIDSDKVYVRADASSVAVRDIRNAGFPLDGLTESDVETWWDADAVIVDDEDRESCCFDDSTENGRGSVVSRCRNAVISCLF